MTIKEIEEASGMQRANIRFYEAEGFLNPEREKNGYRNYTEEDLKILKKIKLLRSLHISLEEIKAMHSGEQDLGKTLEEHIVQLTKQQQELGKSQYVCEKMKQDGANYDSLDTQKYLLVLKNCRPEITEREEWVERDTPEPLQAPFLRIFARFFDYVFYMLLWVFVVFLWHRLTGLTREGVMIGVISSFVMALALALLLEPLFLHWFGATPGKMIMGLKVTYDLGGRIPKDMAWSRAWRAIGGVHDWQYRDLFQTIRIFEAMDAGKPLDWDYVANTTIEQKDDKIWRRIVLAAATVLCIMMMRFTCRGMEMLPNRGNVTAEEFAENYNARLDFQYGGGTKISEKGEWIKKNSNVTTIGGNYVTISSGGETLRLEYGGGPKKLDIKTENGFVTEVGFFYETRNSKEYLDSHRNLMLDIALTFVEAEQDYSVLSFKKWPELKEEVEQAIQGDTYMNVIQNRSIKDFSYTIGGVLITCDVELQGYELRSNQYVAKEGADTYYSVTFSVKKAK